MNAAASPAYVTVPDWSASRRVIAAPLNATKAPSTSKGSILLSMNTIAATITMGWLVTKSRLCARDVWSSDHVHAAKCTPRAKPDKKRKVTSRRPIPVSWSHSLWSIKPGSRTREVAHNLHEALRNGGTSGMEANSGPPLLTPTSAKPKTNHDFGGGRV